VDDSEYATALEERHRADCIAAALRPPPRTRSTGVCNWCGESIEAERLAALPFTPHCRECADELERDLVKAGKRGW